MIKTLLTMTPVVMRSHCHMERTCQDIGRDKKSLEITNHNPKGIMQKPGSRPDQVRHSHWPIPYSFRSVQFSSSVVSDSLPPHESQHTRPLCPSPTPGVHSAHVHWVSDAIQPSRPLSCPSPPAPNPSQHQDLFQWVNSSHQMAKVSEFQLQHQSFQLTPRTDFL